MVKAVEKINKNRAIGTKITEMGKHAQYLNLARVVQ